MVASDRAGAEVLADQLLQALHAADGLIEGRLGNLLLARKAPANGGGLEDINRKSAQASCLDAATEFAAETKGGTCTQNG